MTILVTLYNVIVVKCEMSHTAKQQQAAREEFAGISCHANYKQQTATGALCDVWAFTSGNTGNVRNQR